MSVFVSSIIFVMAFPVVLSLLLDFDKLKLPFNWVPKNDNNFSSRQEVMYVIQNDVSRFLEILVARQVPPVTVVVQVRRTGLSWEINTVFSSRKCAWRGFFTYQLFVSPAPYLTGDQRGHSGT